ncbi:MAG: hypothetical protein IJG68_07635 [Bacilli bacterium]|nr:hypothetical protein [Bacilli bacterium]
MNRKNKNITTYFILFSLLLIGIIYAILQANLQINGTAKIKSNSWDIHFDNIVVNENSVSIGENDSAATIDPNNNCKVDFEVTLSLPGDFYEFTIDVVNSGTIDGMIGELSKTIKINNEIVSEIPNYLNYSVTYEDGMEILPNHELIAGTTETYLVRLEFRSDIEVLPDATTVITTLEPQFIQADSDAIIVNHPVYLYNVIQAEANSGDEYVLEYTGSHKDSFTTNGTEKIYYWTASYNNSNTVLDKINVLFGGYCWQMYRTTDTGGVKLIYNGEPSEIIEMIPLNESDYTIVTNTGNFTWDSSDSTWNATITDNQAKEISFTVPTGENYEMVQTGTSGLSTGGGYTFYKDGVAVNGGSNGGGAAMDLSYSFGTLSSSNVLKMTFSGSSSPTSPITFKISMKTLSKDLRLKCDNTGISRQIGTSAFNTNDNSPAYVGYMYNPNTIITNVGNSRANENLFGNGVTYSNGTYTLTNTSIYDNDHHYTCNNTTGSCSTVRYYYAYDYDVDTNKQYEYYTELSDGRTIEEALEDMLSADDVNQTNSTIKTFIDTWYQNNMTAYTSKLEDTIFCNDRSISNYGGWNPNGGSKNKSLQFKNNSLNNDLSCTNITDQFSMNNNKAQLTYPVGLMTRNESTFFSNLLLTETENIWLLSPENFFTNKAYVTYTPYSGHKLVVSNVFGVRPVVVLKAGTRVTGGDGNKLNPYVVE